MSFEQIIQDIDQQKYSPIYFLMGEEPYYIDEIAAHIENSILNETEKEFNQTIVYGKDTDIATIVSYAKRFPMMANHQVVVVREAQDLKNIEDLNTYASQPLDSTILVVLYKYKKLDKRRSLAKTISRNGVLFESARLYDNKVPSWIQNYLHKRGMKASPEATMLLSEHLGNDLSHIANELQKLMINLEQGSVITPEIVEMNIGISKEFNVFELQRALGTRDILKANRIITHFGANLKENPIIKIISSLFPYFNKLLILHSLQDKSKNAIASALGIHPFFVTEYLQAARHYPSSSIERVVSLLRQYDMKAKGVGNVTADDGQLMKEMVYHILH